MSKLVDRAYYERRAREEISKGERAEEACVKHVHLSLAAEYIRKVQALKPSTG